MIVTAIRLLYLMQNSNLQARSVEDTFGRCETGRSWRATSQYGQLLIDLVARWKHGNGAETPRMPTAALLAGLEGAEALAGPRICPPF